ncbi:MAG: hypothetical protein QW835_07755 [Candidatus Hadarchaeum sp.]
MARTALNPISVPHPYAAAAADLSWTAADAVNGNCFIFSGKEILLAQNTGTSEATITISTVACSHGRTGDIVKVLGAGNFCIFPALYYAEGFMQADGKVYVNANSADVKLAVLRIP